MRWIILLAVSLFFSSGAALPGMAGAEEEGEKFFKGVCAVCHGPKGQGGPLAPALMENEFLKGATVEDMKSLIKNGRKMAEKKYPQFPIEMPAHTQFTDEQIEAIIEYEKKTFVK